MPFEYAIDFIHRDSAGQIKLQKTLAGSHLMSLSTAPGPLDVALEEVPDAGTGAGTFRLTLTEAGTGPRSDISGTWEYEIFFAHERPDGTTNEASLATGSHFMGIMLETSNVEVVLDELVPQDTLNPRLYFTFKSK